MDGPHYRKVDLQSPADLTYLLDNIKKAAQEKIDLAIPPSAAPEGTDAYRIRVEELVHEYIIQTLTLALPSLSINGLPSTPALLRKANLHPSAQTDANYASIHNNNDNNDPDDPFANADTSMTGYYEPYDPRLAERLRALYAQFEDESVKIAELRREAPALAAGAYADVLRKTIQSDTDKAKNNNNSSRRRVNPEAGAENPQKQDEEQTPETSQQILSLRSQGLERREDMEKTWGKSVDDLLNLGTDVTGLLARLERAEKAADVVLGRNIS